MSNKLLAGLFALLFGSSLGFVTVWADEKEGYKNGKSAAHGKGHGYGQGKYGHRGGYDMGRRHGTAGHLIRGLLGGAQEMGLTEDQIKQLKDIKLDLDRRRIQAEADIQIAEREARALMDDDTASLSAIESKLKESASKQVTLRVASVKARRDAMAVLTPEQSKRVKMFHERMRDHSKPGKHGKGMGHHGNKGEKKQGEDDD